MTVEACASLRAAIEATRAAADAFLAFGWQQPIVIDPRKVIVAGEPVLDVDTVAHGGQTLIYSFALIIR